MVNGSETEPASAKDRLLLTRLPHMVLDGAVLDAPQALACGLVLRIEEDPMHSALQLAERYAELNPDLTLDIKHAVRIAETGRLDAVLDFEPWAQASSATGPQIQTAVDRLAGGR